MSRIPKQKAFTLAEVLITLIIIGVLAVITIPSMILKFERNILKNQLKETYSQVAQLDQQFINKTGQNVKEFSDANASNTALIGQMQDMIAYTSYTNTTKASYISQIKKPAGTPVITDIWAHGWIKDKQGKDWFICKVYGAWTDVPQVLIDINGVEKPPNKMGYDAFVFVFQKKGVIMGGDPSLGASHSAAAYCSMGADTWSYNGRACGYWALNNKHPSDNTKNYWDDYLK